MSATPKSSRLEVLRQLMPDNGLDAVVALSSAYHNFLDINPVLSLCDFKNIGEAALIITREGADQLLVSPSWDGIRARSQSSVKEVKATDFFCADLVMLLRHRGRMRLGVTGLSQARLVVAEMLFQADATRPVNADFLLQKVGLFTAREFLDDIKRGVQIAESTYQYFLETAKVGMRECDLAAEVYAFSKEQGADDNFMLIRASAHNEGITVAGTRRIQEHDIIVCEITPSFGGQFVQLPRTATVGQASPMLQKRFDLLLQASRAGVDCAKPGVAISEVAKSMDAVLIAAGFGKYCRPPFMRVRGHGMGNILNAPGDLTPDNNALLQEGMTFVIHAEQYLPDSGYLLVGEPVHITRAGAIVLSARPCALDVIPVH
jgi:Xaa-Pro dipeptidase